MLVLLSPAKRLDEESKLPDMPFSQPQLLPEAEELADVMKGKSEDEIGSLMKLSDKLAALNYERYQSFHPPFTPENARPALFMFKGDVYEKMDIHGYNEEQLQFAQKHLRILSGLYGVLRPLDLMQPYRLEMGTRLANAKGKNLYEFWGSAISENLNNEGEEVILNLASNEYFDAVDKKALKGKLVTVHFKQHKNGKIQTLGMLAKRARGMMADYIIKHAITNLEEVKKFNAGGYAFQAEPSDEHNFYFFVDLEN